MATGPSVSIVLPVWRPEPSWFKAAVRSVLDDDPGDGSVELIIVDDGNDLPISPLLDALADDPRLRIIRVPHGGVARARNAGLAHATGDYVRFVDADDVVVAGGTSALLAVCAGREVIAHGAVELCDADLTCWEVRRSSRRGDATVACLTGRFEVYHPAMLVPRSVLIAIGGWHDLPTCEDWDLVLRAVELAPVEPCPAVVYRYRRWSGSLSKQSTGPARDVGSTIVRAHFDRHPEQRGSRLERRTEAYLVQRSLHRYDAASPWRSPKWWRALPENPSYLTALAQARIRRLSRLAARARAAVARRSRT